MVITKVSGMTHFFGELACFTARFLMSSCQRPTLLSCTNNIQAGARRGGSSPLISAGRVVDRIRMS